MLKKGASLRIIDRLGRTPLEIARERYCHPERVPLLSHYLDYPTNSGVFEKTLQLVNDNTVEIITILASYGGTEEPDSLHQWFHGELGLVTAEMVISRLNEDRSFAAVNANVISALESVAIENAPR